jgi:hypothetical protein
MMRIIVMHEVTHENATACAAYGELRQAAGLRRADLSAFVEDSLRRVELRQAQQGYRARIGFARCRKSGVFFGGVAGLDGYSPAPESA